MLGQGHGGGIGCHSPFHPLHVTFTDLITYQLPAIYWLLQMLLILIIVTTALTSKAWVSPPKKLQCDRDTNYHSYRDIAVRKQAQTSDLAMRTHAQSSDPCTFHTNLQWGATSTLHTGSRFLRVYNAGMSSHTSLQSQTPLQVDQQVLFISDEAV